MNSQPKYLPAEERRAVTVEAVVQLAASQNPSEISLSITSDKVIYLDDKALDLGSLVAALAAIPPGPDGKPPVVVLRADRTVDYGTVMGVMGELNRAGFSAISLVTTGSVPSP